MQARIISQLHIVNQKVIGVFHRYHLKAGDTEGRFTLLESDGKPGMGMPPHIHANEEETVHVLSGTVEFWLDGEMLLAEAGTTIFLPRNTAHGFRIVGDAPAHLLTYISPGGLESMFKELAMIPIREVNINTVTTICDRYGVEFSPIIK